MNFQTEEKLREQFVRVREARDIFHMTTRGLKMNHLQNLPKAERTCPLEARLYRQCGIRIVNNSLIRY